MISKVSKRIVRSDAFVTLPACHVPGCSEHTLPASINQVEQGSPDVTVDIYSGAK
jgi:hypothetical protein